MEFRTDEPGVLAGRTLNETGSAHIDELDLYDELATFSALSPEEQREETERVERANAQSALAVDDPLPVSFDFMEPSDVPTRADRELDRSPEPVFDLIDESQFERIEQSSAAASAEPAFAFVEESSEEPPLTSEASQIAAALPDVLRSTSPLEVIDSGAMTTAKGELKCESCGTDSSPEDLFCLSCGELLGETD
ncbi:MAG: zinc ribbon domain-containing protein [Blastocatellia bacterium]